ncbi:MAG: sodium ion-translocating decarboxylase subunit beta [Clostridiales bacterium]|nr:sodium ion-translocating decarboxylase subunit beta [Clostridiales bacterium]
MELITNTLGNLVEQSGFAQLADFKQIIMILVACVLLYLGIVKKYEPLLLVGIGFGMLLTNLPGSGVYHPELWYASGSADVDWGAVLHDGGFLDILYLGVKLGIYPSLIFVGVGAMTDFGPMMANPSSMLLGAAAQLGVYAALLMAVGLGFSGSEAASIAIIGGADGPTAIWLTKTLAPHLLGAIAVAAYSYMALIPLIQPPIMRALTTEKERQVKMEQLRPVSQTEKIVFPIVVTIVCCLVLPSVASLLGCLMLGNLFKECGVTDRLSDTAQNALMNIVTIFLGISVGATATADQFLSLETLEIIVLGLIAFAFATAGGILFGKIMYRATGGRVNPLIGSAGVSAVPMAARVSQVEGQKWNPSNFLLMHAMGPNVAGVIGSAVAAGFLLAVFG